MPEEVKYTNKVIQGFIEDKLLDITALIELANMKHLIFTTKMNSEVSDITYNIELKIDAEKENNTTQEND